MFTEFKELLKQTDAGTYAALESLSTEAQRNACGDVFEKVVDFLKTNHAATDIQSDLHSGNRVEMLHEGAVESIMSSTEPIMDLVSRCHINENQKHSAAVAVALTLSRHTQSGIVALEDLHKSSEAEYDTVPALGAFRHDGYGAEAALEVFGAETNRSAVDVRLSLAVTLMKYHAALTDRMFHRVAQDKPVVQLKQERAGIYDLSANNGVAGRTGGTSGTDQLLIDAYHDPSSLSTELQEIICRQVNDDKNQLHQEGVLKTGERINMFDLSLVEGKLGHDAADRTDVVAEGAKIRELFIELSDGTTTEVVKVPVETRSSANFCAHLNNDDDAQRFANISTVLQLDQNTLLANGNNTVLFAGCTDTMKALARVEFNATLHLGSSLIHGNGSVDLSPIGDGVTPDFANTIDGITATVVAYRPKAQFSEENMRKSTTGINIISRSMSFNLPPARRFVADSPHGSSEQSDKGAVLAGIAALTRIACDNRSLNMVETALREVKATREQSPDLPDHYSRIGHSYAAGYKCKPYAIIDTLSLADITNEKEGEYMGDLRARWEGYMLGATQEILDESLYGQQLDPNERPHFVIITSGEMIAKLIAVSHYHNHLDKGNLSETGVLTRVLPNGVILTVIESTFKDMKYRQIMVPYRPGKPGDVLNFATNYDMGNITVQFPTTHLNASVRRMVSSNRECPIITNPIGMVLDVDPTSLDEIYKG